MPEGNNSCISLISWLVLRQKIGYKKECALAHSFYNATVRQYQVKDDVCVFHPLMGIRLRLKIEQTVCLKGVFNNEGKIGNDLRKEDSRLHL